MVRLLIYLGSALMVYNIYGFVRFSRYVRKLKHWDEGTAILYFPIVLLVLFLLGYLTVGLFGNPDLVMAGILFGGSIFVFVMYRLLNENRTPFLPASARPRISSARTVWPPAFPQCRPVAGLK